MKENGIPIDDLYTLVRPQLAEIQFPANVHFQPKGYAALAGQVAAQITAAIKPEPSTGVWPLCPPFHTNGSGSL